MVSGSGASTLRQTNGIAHGSRDVGASTRRVLLLRASPALARPRSSGTSPSLAGWRPGGHSVAADEVKVEGTSVYIEWRQR